jgi:hypothetical protein
MNTARGMLALLRSTLRDAAYHGFEAARYSYGCILSMMEDGSLTWSDSTRIAEERRSALIARGTVVPTCDLMPSSNPRRGFNNKGDIRTVRVATQGPVCFGTMECVPRRRIIRCRASSRNL